MSSHDPLFLFEISWIFWSKNDHFILLTIFLNCFQSSNLLVDLYLLRFILQFESYQLFECLVILMIFEFLSHVLLMALAIELITFSSDSTLVKLFESIDLIALIKLLMKDFSSLLSLIIKHFLFWTYSSIIGIVMVSGVWSKNKYQSGWMEWLSSSSDLYFKNIKSMTEFESWLLSEYLVRMWLVGDERLRDKESVMSMSKLL